MPFNYHIIKISYFKKNYYLIVLGEIMLLLFEYDFFCFLGNFVNFFHGPYFSY